MEASLLSSLGVFTQSAQISESNVLNDAILRSAPSILVKQQQHSSFYTSSSPRDALALVSFFPQVRKKIRVGIRVEFRVELPRGIAIVINPSLIVDERG